MTLPDPHLSSFSLDVISALLSVLRADALPLVDTYNLISIVLSACDAADPNIRQSAFALVGDLAQFCFPAVQPFLKQFVELCVRHVDLK